MDQRLWAIGGAAAALVLAAAGSAWLKQQPRPAVIAAPAPVLEHCHRAAELLYEVSWAAACHALKDENDCMLPEAQAARVNALLETELARCMAVESRAARP